MIPEWWCCNCEEGKRAHGGRGTGAYVEQAIDLDMVCDAILAIPHDQTALNRIVAERVLETLRHIQNSGNPIRALSVEVFDAERAVEDARRGK